MDEEQARQRYMKETNEIARSTGLSVEHVRSMCPYVPLPTFPGSQPVEPRSNTNGQKSQGRNETERRRERRRKVKTEYRASPASVEISGAA